MKASTIQTFKIVGALALPLIAILATVMFLFYGQSGDDSAGAAGGAGMSLKFTSPDKSQVITSAEVGSKFTIQVTTNPAPDLVDPVDVGGFAMGVVIPAGGGIKYNGPVDIQTINLLECQVEIHPPILANSTVTTCTTTHTATKHGINVLTAGAVDDGTGPIDGRFGVELADFAYSCNTAGAYEVTVIAADPLTLAGAFYSTTDFAPIQVKTVLAQDGTTDVTASAKITCTEPPPSDRFTVSKEYSDGNTTPVTITLTCTLGGVVSPETAPASPGSPAVFGVTGHTGDPECTATESDVPAGYNGSGDPPGTCQAELVTVGECTITNTVKEGSFTVFKEYSDDNTTAVTIAFTCVSGDVSPETAPASPGSPAVFNVSGSTGDPECTAAESVPSGYNADESGCASVLLSVGTCTITNTLKKAEFTVSKEYSDDNTTAVTITLTCVSGDVSPETAPASPGSPAVFSVSDSTGEPECTAAEPDVPAGYNSDASGCVDVLLSAGSCTITNSLKKDGFTVDVNFSDENEATVSIALSCTSGAPNETPLEATHTMDADFNVKGFTGDPTCTATQSGLPEEYNGSGTPPGTCQAALVAGGCKITNVPTIVAFTVNKDFSDDSTAEVTFALECTDDATVVVVDDTATESPAAAAEFTVSDFIFSGTTCTATETPVPAGYVASGCVAVPIADGTCTITNVLTASFTVDKDFSDDNTAEVTIALVCTDATVVVDDATATEIPADGAEFTVSGFIAGSTTCTATEPDVPAGYVASGCVAVPIADGTCTITNVLTASFTVDKDFSDDNTAEVTIALVCTDATVVVDDATATEIPAEAAEFTVSDFIAGSTTCTATETPVPTGYAASGCVDVPIANGTCTIVNELTVPFTVNKEYSDGTTTPVTITLACTLGGVVSPATVPAAPGSPAVFDVSGHTDDPVCTATESGVPAGYNGSGTPPGTCQAALVAVGSCTITNTLKKDSFTVSKEYSDGNTTPVTITLACTLGGVVSPATVPAAPGSPAVFDVSGHTDDPVCTATESGVPAGYNGSGTPPGTCQAALVAVGSCTITNTLKKDSFTVSKEYSDDNTTPVTITLTCTLGGVVTPATAPAAPDSPAVFNVSGYTDDPECTATESGVPAGYTGDESFCAQILLSVGECTIVNDLNSGLFTVNKEYSDGNTTTVTITLTCILGDDVLSATIPAAAASPAVLIV